MIIINATLEPKEGKLDEIVEKAEAILKASREHEGNIKYNLYKNVEDNTLVMIEQWESKEALQNHMQTDIFKEFGRETKDLLASDLKAEIYSAELLSDESSGVTKLIIVP